MYSQDLEVCQTVDRRLVDTGQFIVVELPVERERERERRNIE